MNAFTALRALRRGARMPALLHLVCAAALACGFLSWPGAARAAVISNTATASFTSPAGPTTQTSNAVTLTPLPGPTPAVVTFWDYAPGNATGNVMFDGGSYDSGGGVFVPLAPPVTLSGTPISLAGPVDVRPTGVYHMNDPVFIQLADGNRNLDPAVREFIEVTVTTSTGDSEHLRLQETGPDTGVFATVIRSTTAAASADDGLLSIAVNSKITVYYQDPIYLDDTTTAATLVDPFGFVFDAVTGAPLDGATVTLIDMATGLPATVLGDDGASSFPSSVVTGSSVADSSGKLYVLPAGGFRFPFVQPGSYRFEVTPPAGYTMPSTVPDASMPSAPGGKPYAVVTGSRGDVFVLVPGPALNIDIPVDPVSGGLALQKQVSRKDATAGDFLQYRLTLRNTSGVATVAATLTDRLPFGLRYAPGSVRVNGAAAPEPVFSSDGRTLTFSLPSIPAGGAHEIRYVAEVGVGAPVGDAVNTASARAGPLTSNLAQASVHIAEPLMSGRATIVGRVFEGDCSTPWQELKGVANARILMEDGTYVITDKDGQYHFNGVRPGTHVVQMDVDSLPLALEPVACIANTRFAGRSFSQFVEVKGGALWRADFFARPRKSSVGIRLQSHLNLQTVTQPAPVAAREIGDGGGNVRSYTLRAEFDSCRATLKEQGAADVEALVQQLSGVDVQRIELTGHTDNQRLSTRCRTLYKDNYALSEARARAVGEALAAALYLQPEQVVAKGKGPDEPVASNRTPDGMARNRRTELKVFLNQADHAAASADSGATQGKRSIEVSGMTHRIEVDGAAPVDNLRVTAMLPEGAVYHRGTARVDGQAASDVVEGDGVLTFGLGKAGEGTWQHVIEFDSTPLASRSIEPESPLRRYTLRARFESCSSTLHPAGREALDALLAEIRRAGRVDRIELIGHSDGSALSARCRARFADSRALSAAQAQAAGTLLANALGLEAGKISASGRGDAEPIADNSTAAGRARNHRIEITVRMADDLAVAAAPATVACPATPYSFKSFAVFESAPRKRAQTPAVETRIGCPAQAVDGRVVDDSSPYAVRADADSTRRQVEVVQTATLRPLPPELAARQKARESIPDGPTAAGARRDFLAGEAPGIAWLFPGPDHNPRAPAVRVAIKHLPGQSVVLKQADGTPVPAMTFDGVLLSGDQRVAVSIWRGVPLKEGDNAFTAEVRDWEGTLVETLRQNVHFGGNPVQARLVPEKSILLADGMNRPVVAVQFLDRDGRPVRAGMTGPIAINAPYRPYEAVDAEQKRQLVGLDRHQPQYTVEGDEGIAYIELAPTSESGSLRLDVNFPLADDSVRRQELRTWLEPTPRDWVLVGFADGTLGYNTLKDNAKALAGQEKDGGYSDGQVSLYAKGRVLGKWLMTMSYDTDKVRDRKSLLGVIDPNQYYTLYGDGTEQRHDAPSQSKLYVKLERGQFYALFGDYDTGLTQTQLSRYSRTLNGFKTEKAGGRVVFTAYAAETPQNSARDEIQGDGTSGLYRLSQANIVLNSEKIRIETRDRLHSEKIISTSMLTRFIDYDIDYANGTLFFRQPIPSRDTNFNPNFIVAEYETLGVAENSLNAGGRVAVNLGEGRVQAGLSAIRDESSLRRGDLAGADVKVRLARDTELRVEAAQTRGQVATLDVEGLAWLTEVEHHSSRYDALVYARRQEPGFGLNQQNASETGMQKVGVDGQLHLGKDWSVLGQLYEQENLGTSVTRDAATGKLQYKTLAGGFSLGAQAIDDRAGSGALAGHDARSEQLTAGANRFFLDRKLELSAQAESAFGGNNQSIDFPDRYLAGASYALTDTVRLLAGQEFTDGKTLNTSTSRVGLQVTPWKGARVDGSLNQSEMGEYGPRTFGQFGLTQGLTINEQWGVDFSVDSSQTLAEGPRTAPVLTTAYPVSPGGSLTGPGLTEDFVAVSTGASWRTPLWSWNGRLEDRNGETTDRYGLTSSFLRQAEAGVAFASRAQMFSSQAVSGTDAFLGSLDLSWAWRPLGEQWSILDRLEFRYESVANGSGIAGSAVLGQAGLVGNNASTRRVINNFALNRVSREWTGEDRTGNLFRRYERNQFSLYYGAKYVMDRFDGADYDGYTDLLGVEVRHDLRDWLDVGVQASSLNSWGLHAHAYSVGPMVGASPVENGWVTLGWNLRGFRDTDFDAARYTAQGPYLQLRFKFDQKTRLRGSHAVATDTEDTERVR